MKEPFDLSASRTSFCGIAPAFPFVLHFFTSLLFLKSGQAAESAAHPLKKGGKGGNVGEEERIFLKSLFKEEPQKGQAEKEASLAHLW